jgi:hypothetical protein
MFRDLAVISSPTSYAVCAGNALIFGKTVHNLVLCTPHFQQNFKNNVSNMKRGIETEGVRERGAKNI